MKILTVWGTIGSVLLFIVALSALIVIHELGHFIAAKSFKVYCSDFSIGFGPKFIKIKRKKGETRFNMGIIPLGGYVSMYGEGIELPDGQKIPKSRSLNGINRWKRAIIMAAGIFMNFVLAYVIFFISASCFPQHINYMDAPDIKNQEQYQTSKRVIDLNTNDVFDFKKDDTILMSKYGFTYKDKDQITPVLLQTVEGANLKTKEFAPAHFTFVAEDGKSYNYVFGVNFTSMKQTEDYANGIVAYLAEEYPAGTVKYATKNEKDEVVLVPTTKAIYLPKIDEKENKLITYKFNENTSWEVETSVVRKEDTEDETAKYDFFPVKLKLEGTKENKLEPLYIGCLRITYWNGWQSFKVAGQQWVDSTGAVANALGGLFVGKNWDQVGGPLAIFNQTTMILEEFPFNYYLNTWGVISVNLALFNLLPFPGLDGWQLLVTGIEGTVNLFTRAKYRKKYQKQQPKVNSKPEKSSENVENVENATLVADEKVATAKYDGAILKQLSELNDRIYDIEKAYMYKFNKKYDHQALVNVFSDPENEESYKTNEEYQYFVDRNNAVQEKEEFILLNNLSEVEPYKEWGIPETTKNIVSYIGLGLLMLLAVAIFVMDIIKMI